MERRHMKLGEIKIEALKLMFATGNRDVGVSDLEGMVHEEEYADYLLAMPGAINRCFAVLEERRVLPVKSFRLGEGGRYALDELIPDIFDIERIVYEGEGEYDGDCEYFREGDSVIIRDFDSHGEYRVLYKPSLERITSYTPDDTELKIPDRIACLIPYFIKSELFRVDEPDEAAEARNLFEMSIEQISKREDGRQSRVAHSYSFSEV